MPIDHAAIKEEALTLHRKRKGKFSIQPTYSLQTKKDLSLAYTPGVAEPSRQIAKDKSLVYEYCAKGNLVAVVSDGTSVLGLGNIGPYAAIPVMEGKAVLFKRFANIDAFPLCLDTEDTSEIVETVKRIAPMFGGILLEDISGPRCIEIERRLIQELDIPVMHDDQHGTAIVALAGLINALNVVGKNIEEVRVVINGAGAAGIAVARLLLCLGIDKKICTSVKEIILCDRAGALYDGRQEDMNYYKAEIAKVTNLKKRKGSLHDMLQDADIFIGLSGPNILNPQSIKGMAERPVIFAMANPDPEIMPELAKEAGAAIVATGRSDYPNQINNVLAFPGLFRGALDVRARAFTPEMKIAAAWAIANCVKHPTAEYIVPDPFEPHVAEKVAEAVKKAAIKSGVARVKG